MERDTNNKTTLLDNAWMDKYHHRNTMFLDSVILISEYSRSVVNPSCLLAFHGLHYM